MNVDNERGVAFIKGKGGELTEARILDGEGASFKTVTPEEGIAYLNEHTGGVKATTIEAADAKSV